MSNMGRSGWGARIALLGFVLGIGSAAGAIAAGLGNRMGWWTYRGGFAALEWIVYFGAAAAVISLIGVALSWREARRGLIFALIGLVAGAATAWIPYQGRMALRASPRLPDVTTDTANPPAFLAAIEERKRTKARNNHNYERAYADVQAKYYPDIKPVMLKVPPAQAFERAVSVINAMGFHIIAADEAAGRIEATATTFWFGFKDDVVIRVTAAPGGSRVDIRSTSRVGGRDASTNANRVRAMAAKIAAN